MNWPLFCCVTLTSFLISFIEWSKLKRKPMKDRVTFVVLLLFIWFMFMFDLPHTPGPIKVIEFVFKPLAVLLQ